MARPSKVDVGGWSGAIQAHSYWARALNGVDADKITLEPRAARKAFNTVSKITASVMEDWLARWPNTLGSRRYRAAMR